MITSTEHLHAVVAAWAVAWVLTSWGMDHTAAFIIAWLLWCAICGTYRRRRMTPTFPD